MLRRSKIYSELRGSITIIETVLVMSLIGIVYLAWYHHFKDRGIEIVAKEKCVVDAGAALNDDESIVDPDFETADPCATAVPDPAGTPIAP